MALWGLQKLSRPRQHCWRRWRSLSQSSPGGGVHTEGLGCVFREFGAKGTRGLVAGGNEAEEVFFLSLREP